MVRRLVFLMCMLMCTGALAKNHVILAFDEAGTSWRQTDDKVRQNVEYFLFDNDGNPLLSKGDYLSVVGVKGDCSARGWKDFVYVKSSFIDDYNTIKSMMSTAEWPNQVRTPEQYSYESSYSLISIAKPYILAKLGKGADKAMVDRTYMIFVTDHRYNGNDYYNELQYFLGDSAYINAKIDIHDVLKVCYDVEREYCIEYLDVKKWPFSPSNGMYKNVELFEVSPNQEYLTLPAVIDYSPSLTAVRKRGHSYEVTLDLVHSNSHFEMKELIVYKCSEFKAFEEPIDTLASLDRYSRTYVFDRSEKISHLRMTAKLKLNDGIYDATLLTPDTVPGLNQTVKVNTEEDSRILFGLAPLPDWMWPSFVETQQAAAIVVSFLILILCAIAMLAYIYATKTYKPKSEEVRIKFYD